MDVVKVAASLCQQRRNMFRDREHLLFAHQAVLFYAQQLLIKRTVTLSHVFFNWRDSKAILLKTERSFNIENCSVIYKNQEETGGGGRGGGTKGRVKWRRS